MSAQMAEPATPPGGIPRLREGEFHPITSSLVSDVTETQCQDCEFAEHSGPVSVIAHGADHAIATGHTVSERHTRVSVIRERPVGRLA